ncbi:MAG: benzoate/H(+) symporter BenE family transporter [Pseudomonadota bacterium]
MTNEHLRDLGPAFATGVLAAFVGFASSFAVVIQGLKGVGASPEQAASGLMVASISMGLCGVLLSLRTRIPVSVAWSTPGAAFLATAAVPQGGFGEAVGAFLICAVLIMLAGLVRPFGKIVAAIPTPLASAMLAGILLSLCLAPIKAIAFDPLLGLPIVIAWVVGGQINKLMAVPFALLAFFAVVAFGVAFPADWTDQLAAAAFTVPVWIAPSFSLEAALGIAFPLFVVTMASQNIPGIAVLLANGYAPKTGPLLTTTGVFSFVGAPLGAHAVNLAAITAAMLTGEEAGKDPNKRYVAAIICGLAYVLFGLTAGMTTAFVSFAPGVLIEAVAGLALIAAFSGAALAAFSDEDMRMPAALTFLASASGVSILGVSGAFWGLLGGWAIVAGLGAVNRTKI